MSINFPSNATFPASVRSSASEHRGFSERQFLPTFQRFGDGEACNRRDIAPHDKTAGHPLKTSPQSPLHRLAAEGLGRSRHYGVNARIASAIEGRSGVWALRSGWACVERIFADGQRQIQHVLLPGEIIGSPNDLPFERGIVALTPASVVSLDGISEEAVQKALRHTLCSTHVYLLNQTVRLGRQSAYERLAHLLLEFRDRLLLTGWGSEREFPMPLTQEVLADVLGMTSVHINRTLQRLRRDGLIQVRDRVTELLDIAALRRIADYQSSPQLAC